MATRFNHCSQSAADRRVQSSYCCKVGSAIEACEWQGALPACAPEASKCASDAIPVFEDPQGAYYETHNQYSQCAGMFKPLYSHHKVRFANIRKVGGGTQLVCCTFSSLVTEEPSEEMCEPDVDICADSGPYCEEDLDDEEVFARSLSPRNIGHRHADNSEISIIEERKAFPGSPRDFKINVKLLGARWTMTSREYLESVAARRRWLLPENSGRGYWYRSGKQCYLPGIERHELTKGKPNIWLLYQMSSQILADIKTVEWKLNSP